MAAVYLGVVPSQRRSSAEAFARTHAWPIIFTMRLRSVERQIPLHLRLFFAVTGLFGADVPMVRAVSHRPSLFGSSFSLVAQATMRGESPWSSAERELFASFSASLEQCPY
jgi:hypothetical protein